MQISPSICYPLPKRTASSGSHQKVSFKLNSEFSSSWYWIPGMWIDNKYYLNRIVDRINKIFYPLQHHLRCNCSYIGILHSFSKKRELLPLATTFCFDIFQLTFLLSFEVINQFSHYLKHLYGHLLFNLWLDLCFLATSKNLPIWKM